MFSEHSQDFADWSSVATLGGFPAAPCDLMASLENLSEDQHCSRTAPPRDPAATEHTPSADVPHLTVLADVRSWEALQQQLSMPTHLQAQRSQLLQQYQHQQQAKYVHGMKSAE